jgi:acetyltransferase-like isoleucine patch superfamily enzyme
MSEALRSCLRVVDQAVLFAGIARGYLRAKLSAGKFGPFPVLTGRVRLRIRGKAPFGERFMVEAQIWNVGITVAEGGTLTVGDSVFVNGGVSIEAWHDVRIGDYVMLAPFAAIIDDDRHEAEPDAPMYHGPTIIGDTSLATEAGRRPSSMEMIGFSALPTFQPASRFMTA